MKKTFIIIALVLLIAAAAYFYITPGQNVLEVVGLKKPAVDPAAGATAAVKDDMTKSTATDGNFVKQPAIVKDLAGFPLVEGDGSMFSPNKSVKEIQQALNERHGTSLKIDGVFGPKTAKALNVHGYPQVIYLDDYLEIRGI